MLLANELEAAQQVTQKIRILVKICTQIRTHPRNPYMYGYICTSGNTDKGAVLAFP